MNKLVGVILLSILLIGIGNAVEDTFLINVTALPEWYGIDYGTAIGCVIHYYNISSPIALNDSMNSWTLLASNDGLFYTVIDYQVNESLLADTYKSYSIYDTSSYKYYVILLNAGFAGMTGKSLNLSIFETPTGLSSFVLSNIVGLNITQPESHGFAFIDDFSLPFILFYLGACAFPFIDRKRNFLFLIPMFLNLFIVAFTIMYGEPNILEFSIFAVITLIYAALFMVSGEKGE